MFAPLNPRTRIVFTSQAALAPGSGSGASVVAGYELRARVEAVKGCRSVGKRDMKWNDATPKMKVDPETYRVEADGVHLVAEPVDASEGVPGGQEYFIY